MQTLLSHEALLALHGAATTAGLSGKRLGLLVAIDPSIVTGLPLADDNNTQMLSDLGELNAILELGDGSVPLQIWLANAVALAHARVERDTLARTLDRVGAAVRERREKGETGGDAPRRPPDLGEPVDFAQGPFAVISRDDGGGAVVIRKSPFTVGRSSSADFVVGVALVSREHAAIKRSGDALVVSDLGSTRGTRVNGIRISHFKLRDGDVVDVAAGPLMVGILPTLDEAVVERERRLQIHLDILRGRTPYDSAPSGSTPSSVLRRALRRDGQVCLVRLQSAHLLEREYGAPTLGKILADVARAISHAAPPEVALRDAPNNGIAVIAPRVRSRDGGDSLARDVRRWVPSEVPVLLAKVPLEISVKLLGVEEARRYLR